MENILYDIWLKTLKFNGQIKIRLIDCLGNSEAVYKASLGILKQIDFIDKSIINTILENKDLNKAQNIYDTMKEEEIRGVPFFSAEYPKHLREIYNPPFMLYIKGRLLDIDLNAIAIVGARKATSYGKWAAYNIASNLSEHQITVVSGMAFGADTYAHKGAIDTGGRTIAVLGCGVDVCYPKSNRGLFEKILRNGAVISEYEPGTMPLPAFFPARNRIISGISRGVVVVEAGLKSGSLITAEFALNQGRDVYAVPGNIESIYSKGTNMLIKEGAIPIIGIEEFLRDLNIEDSSRNYKDIELGNDEKRVLKTIVENQPVGLDLLMYKLNMHASEISALLTIMEIKGLVEVLSGKIVIAK